MMNRIKKTMVGGLGAVLLLAACGGGASGISVEDAWGRTSPKVAAHGAFYMDITGGDTDDVLVAGTSDACATIEMHETVMKDGVMKMQHLPDGMVLPAGGEVSLKPGGLHIMCIEKQVDFTEGTIVTLTLDFEHAEPRTVEVEIRDE